MIMVPVASMQNQPVGEVQVRVSSPRVNLEQPPALESSRSARSKDKSNKKKKSSTNLITRN